MLSDLIIVFGYIHDAITVIHRWGIATRLYHNDGTQLQIVRLHLCVYVAKRPGKRVSSVSDSDGIHSHETQIQRIIQGSVSTRRLVVHSNGGADRILPVCDILVLPDPPNTVDHSVVEVKIWVTRGGEKITSRVSSDREVTGGVHTEETAGEVSLHPCGEGGEVGEVGDQR